MGLAKAKFHRQHLCLRCTVVTQAVWYGSLFSMLFSLKVLECILKLSAYCFFAGQNPVVVELIEKTVLCVGMKKHLLVSSSLVSVHLIHADLCPRHGGVNSSLPS